MHQVHGLRKAFATLSDVMIEEVDHIRSEAKERHEDLTSKLAAQAKAIKAARTELTLLRAESQAGRSALQTKVVGVEEKVEALNDDLTTLTQEVTKGASAQHVMQLDQVELRGIVDEEQRERRSNLEAAEERGANLANRIDSLSHDSRASMQALAALTATRAVLPLCCVPVRLTHWHACSQALDADVRGLRADAEERLGAHASAIDSSKAKLLQCAQARILLGSPCAVLGVYLCGSLGRRSRSSGARARCSSSGSSRYSLRARCTPSSCRSSLLPLPPPAAAAVAPRETVVLAPRGQTGAVAPRGRSGLRRCTSNTRAGVRP